jgi:pimeloyl-ACP methyl ester carboxylesterase
MPLIAIINVNAPLTASFQFRAGTVANSPVLLPLPDRGTTLRSLLRFCRRACPGVPILIPRIEKLRSGAPIDNAMIADCLSLLIAKAVKAHGLSMIPIIVVGHADGADLAAQLALRHASLLAACILLLPATEASNVPLAALDGLHILVIVSGCKEGCVSAGQQISNVLEELGAAVICERVPPRRSLGPYETAIARVFIAALFGEDWPPQSARMVLPGDVL